MNIGIDIDDCLANYMPVFLDRIDHYYNIKVSIKDLNNFSAKTEDYGYITPNQAKKLLSLEKKDEVLLGLPPQSGAAPAVNNLAASNKIIIITSRNNYNLKMLKKHTNLWLNKHGFLFHEIRFSQDKGQSASKLGIDIFIEDSLKFAKQLIDSGVKVILYAQPWNDNYVDYLGQELSQSILGRTNSWKEIMNIVEKETKL